MSEAQILANLLSASHKRLIATIMGQIEKDVYPCLAVEQRRDLRRVIIQAASVYHDTALDCLKATSPSPGDFMINQHLLDLLEQIHRAVYVPKGRG